MVKNRYFNTVEKIAKEMNYKCDKHDINLWTNPHPQMRVVTFYHKVLSLRFRANGTYEISSGYDGDFEIFNKLFKEMTIFIKKVKEEQSRKVRLS